MPSLMDEAVAALQKLSPARRDEIAGFVLDLAKEDDEPEVINPAHLPAVLEALTQVSKEEFASASRVEEVLAKFAP